MKSRSIAALALVGVLAGCGEITEPVAVISSNGDIMRGTTTASLSGGVFHASGKMNGKEVSCGGDYNALDTSITITMPVHCSDGRKGFVIATRQSNGVDGSGRVRLNDGTEADFVFGKAAAGF